MCLRERAQLIVAHTNVMTFREDISLELSSLRLLTSPTEPGYLVSSFGMGYTGISDSLASCAGFVPHLRVRDTMFQFDILT